MAGMNKEKKRILAIFLLALFFLAGRQLTNMVIEQRNAREQGKYPMSRDVYLLDTFCTVTVYEGGGEEALSAAVEALNRYDDLFNYSKEGSDLWRINHRTEDRVEIADETLEMLKLARSMCELSGGVLEPAIRPVTELWDFKDEKKVPEEQKLKEALGRVKSLAWDVNDGAFIAYDRDVRIDVGAIAKGYIADLIKAVMKEHGVSSGIVNLGGNVLCIGHRPDGSAFSVGITDPGSKDGYWKALELDDISAVTAGAYERCFEENGIRYHHIIDPSTGYPARSGLESVTVTGPVSAVCDGLSTTLFILGEEQGTAFLERWNADHDGLYTAYFLPEKNL